MKTRNLVNYYQIEKNLIHLSNNYHKKQLPTTFIKMNCTNFCSRISKQIKSKNEEVHNLEKGITKALLEKYKPKILYNIETLNEKKAQRSVA